MIRNRLHALALLVAGLVAGTAGQAFGAADVHKFNLVISANPMQIEGGDFTKNLDWLNDNVLEPRGLKGFDRITYNWYFEAQMRYFVRQNVALNVGVGQMRNNTKREYLPALRQDIQLRFETFAVPVHAGAAYYFTPYNQGDFQARAYVGGGLLANVQSRILYQQFESNTDTTTSLGGSRLTVARRNAPGFYGEMGVHMFFASRFSVILGAIYRSAKADDLRDRDTGEPVLNLFDGKPASVDLSGIGARLGVAIGLP